MKAIVCVCTCVYVQSIRFDSAFPATTALLAVEHAAPSVKQLTHNRFGFFNQFYRLFSSLVVLRTLKEQWRKSAPRGPTDSFIRVPRRITATSCSDAMFRRGETALRNSRLYRQP
ncbi:hypothetical protein Y032_0283g1312 [Ancylostoma ceylanicum]|uniref:Uncharacterized protein n=1 Tax=Ancylostoma ceylanicum TaxID=53326 RepID=A0A016S7G6_9BILA|nr:hypothetical protein Y032_0283g1312 [Ancylostoma ceylanicum]